MTNQVYLTPNISDTLSQLPKDQQTRVIHAIDSLEEDPLQNSYVIAGDDSPGGGLRAAHAGNLRLLLRYAPESHTVIITDLSSTLAEDLTAATA